MCSWFYVSFDIEQAQEKLDQERRSYCNASECAGQHIVGKGKVGWQSLVAEVGGQKGLLKSLLAARESILILLYRDCTRAGGHVHLSGSGKPCGTLKMVDANFSRKNYGHRSQMIWVSDVYLGMGK